MEEIFGDSDIALPEPMLTTPTTDPHLAPGWAAEPEWDGYHAQLARYGDGRVLLRSRRGTDMGDGGLTRRRRV
ncbi:hypothetical protein ACWGJU_25525, partial [Streptomyces bobili]